MLARMLNWKIIAVVTAVLAGFTSIFVIAANSCLDEVCFGLPEITSGTVIDEQYFSGTISIGVDYEVKDLTGKKAYYTLDDGANWASIDLNSTPIKLPIPKKAFGVSTAVLADGNIVAVWGYPHYEQFSPYYRRLDHLYARIFDPVGEPVSSQFAVDNLIQTKFTGKKINQTSSSVVALPEGGFVVVWGTRDGSAYSYDSGVYARTFNSAGTPLMQSKYIVSGFAGLINPATVLPNREILIVWYGINMYTSDGSRRDKIYMRKFNKFLQPQGNMIPVTQDAKDFGVALLDMEQLDGGNFIVSWNHGYKQGSQYASNVHARCFNSAGNTITSVFRVNDYVSGYQETPSITKLSDGGILMSWVSLGQDGSGFGVYAKNYSSDCVSIGNEYRINDSTLGDQGSRSDQWLRVRGDLSKLFSVAPLSGGDAITAWYSKGELYPFYRILSVGQNSNERYLKVGDVAGYMPHSLTPLPGNNMIYISKPPYTSPNTPANYYSNAYIIPVPDSKLIAEKLSPKEDISIRFKFVDTGTGQEWHSPVRNYTYADPNDGQSGGINYTNGYSNATGEQVTIDMPCNTCKSLQLYQRSAILTNDSCGSFGAWAEYGSPSTLDKNVLTAVEDGRCYQYKATATNVLGNSFEYTSPNIVKVDQSAPVISVASQNRVWDQLALTLYIADTVTNVSGATFQVNSQPEAVLAGNTLATTLLDGLNRITISATDAAGNVGVYNHFVTVDLTPADIVIHGIEDGGVYGSNLSLAYSLTQDLTDVTVLVDGQPRSDLVGLADGTHTLTITGKDAQGKLVTKTVTFTIDSTLFTINVLSPQTRQYETNTLNIQYSASKPVKRAWYKLNGGPDSTDLLLSNLADGNYNLVLYAESDTSATTSTTVNFSVKLGVPSLQVVDPVAGKTYAENRIRVSFASDYQVNYQLDGGASSPITSGDNVDVSGDGSHTIVFTATHPVSGNVTSESVQFSVDTKPLEIELLSPQSRLYAFTDIPVEYNANKSLKNVDLTLDGAAVSNLTGLTPGLHSFRLTAEDEAGRIVEKQVQFTVSLLDIVSPQDGTDIVSNSVPPALPFQYNASGDFTTISASLDKGPHRLLTDPPGSVIPINMAPGNHEIRLQGNVNEFSVGKRSQFKIGAKNIRAGHGSIDYRYDNCDADRLNCDVYATLTIKNVGDLDVNESFQVRFDHIADNGFQTQWRTVGGLAIGATAKLTLDPFRARIGDTMLLMADPFAEAVGEWPDDNAYSLTFQLGQITDVQSQLSFDNAFIEGVSVFNLFAVSTAGPISSLELHMNDWVFADNDPLDGFVVMGDMGMLTRVNNCVQVVARGNSQEVLDSRNVCFNVKELALQDVTPLAFPWAQFASGANYVATNMLNTQDVALALAEAKHQALLQPTALVPMLLEDGMIDYKLISDPAAVQDMDYSRNVNLGTASIVGGQTALPNGHGLFVTTLSSSDTTCTVDGAIPILTESRSRQLDEKYANEIDQINDAFKLGFGGIDPYAQMAFLSFSSMGLPYYSRWQDVAEIEIDSSRLPEEMTQLFGDIDLTTTLDLNLTFVGWVRGDIPTRLAYVGVEGSYEYGFDSQGCLVIDSNNNVSLSLLGRYHIDANANINVNTAGAEVSIAGALIPDIGNLPILNVPMAGFGDILPRLDNIPLFSASVIVMGEVKIYPQRFNIPINLGVGVDISVIDQKLYFGPASAYYDIGIKHSGTLAAVEISAYPVFLGGFGYGEDYKLNLALDGIGKADVGAGNHRAYDAPDSYAFSYSKIDGQSLLYKRKRYCFMGLCYSRSWKLDSVLDEEHDEDGVNYSQSQVEQEKTALEGFDLGTLNDLTSLGLYSLLTGDVELAQEYIDCGLFQQARTNLTNIPLYSNRTGQCSLVTDPDYRFTGTSDYYTDASCSNSISYNPVPFFEYCKNNLLGGVEMKNYVGNSAAWTDSGDYSGVGIKSSAWTLAHGPTLDILSTSPQGNMRPYMKQMEYRNVVHPTTGETCHLEMRVYKKDIQATGLKPFMFIHGGSWTYRGVGVAGMTALISHLTERGYIVFTPFYRLMGKSDGPSACQVPTGTDNISPGKRIVDDMEAALAWVKMHGDKFGAAPSSQVSLAGQSAGSHLAGWLASHFPSDIRNVLLFYPPADTQFFVEETYPTSVFAGSHELYVTGFELAKGLISEFLNYQDYDDMAAKVDVNNLPAFLQNNSFPNIVRSGIDHPPTFMIHGNADSVVPIELSTVMCDALAGLPELTTSTAGGVYTCGSSRGTANKLYVIPDAGHVLDLKCFLDPFIIERTAGPQKYCTAGSLDGEAQVRAAVNDALQWLQ